MKIEENAYGKINLALEVLYKREDGYHEINSLMQQIDLKDRVILKEASSGVQINCDNHLVPLDQTNLVYRAWEEIVRLTGTKVGIRVDISKKIPVAAGLAGGSANGAAVLMGLNKMWDLGMTKTQLMEIGAKIGADIPFCILGGTALAEGIGEKLTSLKSFKEKHILLANPGIGISSAYAYGRIKISKNPRPLDGIMECMENDDLDCLAKSMFNIFEDAIIPENPIIGNIKSVMEDNGALRALMSGSGATVFGLYDDRDRLDYTKKKLENMVPYVFDVATI